MYGTNAVQPGTNYSAGFAAGDFLDQTISDNMVICMHCRNFNTKFSVWWKSVIIVLIRGDLGFIRSDTGGYVPCNFYFWSLEDSKLDAVSVMEEFELTNFNRRAIEFLVNLVCL